LFRVFCKKYEFFHWFSPMVLWDDPIKEMQQFKK